MAFTTGEAAAYGLQYQDRLLLTSTNNTNNTTPHLLEKPADEQLLLAVSTPLLLLTMAPLLLVMWISHQMDLSLERPIIVGAIRTFVQLSILGMILEPIFVRGETCGWLVIGYCMLMILLAAYESMNRSRYQFPGMFPAVLVSLGFNVLWVALFAFGIVLKPDPLWDPQYVIPIVGMLLGNCISGISLSLNNMLTALVEQAREIELYLSFGATPREATARLSKEAVRVGAMPQLNSMAIIGIISIPGMMTGQILGGSPVTQAARYQMLIMYLIAMCTFGTILTEVTMALSAGFDPSFRLRTDLFVDTKKGNAKSSGLKWLHVCCCCGYCCYNWFRGNEESAYMDLEPKSNGDVTVAIESSGLLANAPIPKNKIELHPVHILADSATNVRLDVSNLTHSFAIPEEDEEENGAIGSYQDRPIPTPGRRRRILFENLNLELKAGELTLVAGASGAGKSTFLRLLAGLEPVVGTARHPEGSIQLHVTEDKSPKTYDSQRDRNLWRQQVRYVTQFKVDLPGTPRQFIQRIMSLQIAHRHPINNTANAMVDEVKKLLGAWGMDPTANSLESEWSTLSGGEAQRVIVAIALASHPKVLLLDESTAALDLVSKKRVEKSVLHYCQTYKTSVLWITHDPEQMERLKEMCS